VFLIGAPVLVLARSPASQVRLIRSRATGSPSYAFLEFASAAQAERAKHCLERQRGVRVNWAHSGGHDRRQATSIEEIARARAAAPPPSSGETGTAAAAAATPVMATTPTTPATPTSSPTTPAAVVVASPTSARLTSPAGVSSGSGGAGGAGDAAAAANAQAGPYHEGHGGLQPCRWFGTSAGCIFGANCFFPHLPPDEARRRAARIDRAVLQPVFDSDTPFHMLDPARTLWIGQFQPHPPWVTGGDDSNTSDATSGTDKAGSGGGNRASSSEVVTEAVVQSLFENCTHVQLAFPGTRPSPDGCLAAGERPLFPLYGFLEFATPEDARRALQKTLSERPACA